MQQFKSAIQLGVVVIAASVMIGCASAPSQATHHWVSQDKVAHNLYRQDVASCSHGDAQLDPASAEFKAYQQCMNARGYTLVAANDVGLPGRD